MIPDDQENLAHYEIQQQDFVADGYNQEEYEYDVRPRLKLQTINESQLVQPQRSKSIVHKPKGFNIT